MTQRLEKSTFKTVVASTPLISIDLIVRNSHDQVLLGFRSNRPAQGYWFVPGGRIYKNETFEQAFSRLTQAELGKTIELSTASSLGVYEHFYVDNFSGPEFSTHYVVLGYQMYCDIGLDELPVVQHEIYKWFHLTELLSSDFVHQNTKAYFSDNYKKCR